MPTPADNFSQIPNATAPNADSTALGSFPNLARVVASDAAIPEVANRQEAALEARTETLRTTVNQLVGVINQLDTWFVRRDGSAQKDSNSGFQGDMTFNSHRALGLPAPVDPSEPLRLADLSLLPSTLPTQAPQTLLGNTLGIAAQPTAVTPAQVKALLGLSYAATTNSDNHFTVNQTVSGVVFATEFSGSGASLTHIPATSLTGVIVPARLPTFTRTTSGAIPAPGGSGTARFLREDGTWSDVSASVGVQTFNGRTGTVMPQAGDYNAAQVGALSGSPIAAHTVIANPTGASASPSASTLGEASFEFNGTTIDVKGATYPLHATGERLAIFYHDLTQVNGITDPIQIAHFFTDNYDALVLVWLLNLPTSPSYAQTVAVVNEIKRTRPDFCLIGYVHMGETIAPIHTVADIELYVDQWATLHCDGIFMDECEYGFQTPRSKINAVLAYIHGKKSNAGRRMFGLVNCWNHAELITGSVDATYNPTGVGADFAPGDALFHESLTYHYAYVFGSGGYDNYISAAFLWSKEAASLTLRNAFGLHYYGSNLLPTSGGSAGTGTPIATESQIKQIWQDCASGARLLGADAFCLTYEGYSGGGAGSITPRQITSYPRSLAYADRVEPSPRLVAVTEDVGGTPTITKIVRGPLTYVSYLPAAGPALHYFVDPAVPASIPTELRFLTTENTVDKAPSDYPNVAFGAELKQVSTVDIPAITDFFAGLVTLNQWNDSSGGHALQMGWTDLGPYWRLGVIGGANWGDWNPMGLAPIGTVTAGSYTAANVTIDAYGRVTAVSSGSILALTVQDTRTVNTTPAAYLPYTLSADFKEKAAIGITGGSDVYGGVMTLKPWNDGTGGKATQIGMSDAGLMYRQAANDATTWGAWATLTAQGNAFNGNSQLVQTTAGGLLPALSGANLTSLNASNLSSGTVPSAALPAFTGDVTKAAGSASTVIAAGAVTYAKIQNTSAASVLLGRGGASGSGAVQEITLGTNLSMSGTTLNAAGGSGGSFSRPWVGINFSSSVTSTLGLSPPTWAASVGSTTLPANAFAVGTALRIKGGVRLTAGATACSSNVRLHINGGGPNELTTGSATSTVVDGSFEFVIVCVSTGASGTIALRGILNDATGVCRAVNDGSAYTFDTTATSTFEMRLAMSTTSGSPSTQFHNVTYELIA